MDVCVWFTPVRFERRVLPFSPSPIWSTSLRSTSGMLPVEYQQYSITLGGVGGFPCCNHLALLAFGGWFTPFRCDVGVWLVPRCRSGGPVKYQCGVPVKYQRTSRVPATVLISKLHAESAGLNSVTLILS